LKEDELIIKSYNVKGFKEYEKRCEVFSWIKKNEPNILLLQETHSRKDKKSSWFQSWGNNNIFFSHGSTRAKGVCICISSKTNFKLLQQMTDRDGRVIILDIEINNIRYTVANIYAPNEDSPQFFINVFKMLDCFNNENIVLGGDMNLVFDITMDKKGGKATTHFKCRECLQDYMKENNLIDVWRRDHPKIKAFTWKSYKKPFIYCRLDHILASQNMSKHIIKSKIGIGFKSDHNLIEITYKKNDNIRGPGFWKLNCTLLENQGYIDSISKCIYNCELDNPDTSRGLLWDTMKCRVRGASVKYSAWLKREKNKNIKYLEHRLSELKKVSENDTHNELHAMEIQRLNFQLEEYIEKECKGAEIRSKSQYYEHGEKNSKFFYSLEKRNAEKKHITVLENGEGEIITDMNEILEEEVKYYECLYKSQHVSNHLTNEIEESFLCDKNLYNNIILEDLDITFDVEKLKQVVDSFKCGKSPGSDGLPVEFYKTFWDKIHVYLINSYKDIISNGHLGFSQKQGVISLIPKKDKDPKHLKNWRPITLLNTDYKILTKYIAEYMKEYLSDLIHVNQKGFLSNRYIGENIQNAEAIMNHCDMNNIDSLLIFLDYSKAFDCVEWHLIDKALSMYGFKDNLRMLIGCIYNLNDSCIVNNGNISRYFKLSRGLRQGCPLSPYLFILIVELLANAIRKNKNITGITINNTTCKLNQYADDTFFTILNDAESVKNIFDTIECFRLISGLALNKEKTEVLHIGPGNCVEGIDPKWIKNEVSLLGIKLCKNKLKFPDINFEGKMDKIDNCLEIWKHRNLSLIGRINIIKSLASSQLVYLWSNILSPSESFFKSLDKKLFSFLWNSPVDRIKRQTMTSSYEQGGLKMVDCRKQHKALKMKWLSNILCQYTLDAKDIWYEWLTVIIPDVDILYFLKCNLHCDDCTQLLKIPKNNFWHEVIYYWCELNFDPQPLFDGEIRQQCLWFNSLIKCGKKVFFKKSWYQHGIKTLEDLIVNNRWITPAELSTKTGLNINFLDLMGLIKSMPVYWNFHIENENYETCKYKIDTIELSCKQLYTSLIDKYVIYPEQYAFFWRDQLHIEIDELDWIENYIDVFNWTVSTKLRSFMYQLRMNDIMCNHKLFKMKKREDSCCDWCKAPKQDVIHLFWECKYVNKLWHDITMWINENLQCELVIRKELVFMYDIEAGNLTRIINLIILICCRYIYVKKCLNELPVFQGAVHKILQTEKIERGISISKNKLHLHFKKWNQLSKINDNNEI